jgi:hypothetical protein
MLKSAFSKGAFAGADFGAVILQLIFFKQKLRRVIGLNGFSGYVKWFFTGEVRHGFKE